MTRIESLNHGQRAIFELVLIEAIEAMDTLHNALPVNVALCELSS